MSVEERVAEAADLIIKNVSTNGAIETYRLRDRLRDAWDSGKVPGYDLVYGDWALLRQHLVLLLSLRIKHLLKLY